MNTASPPLPTKIQLHNKRNVLSLAYANGESLELPCEYLRVFSPSAEVRGHGQGQEVLQSGKKDVGIERIDRVGNYAIQLTFDDGHNSGIYAWDYLYQLGCNHEQRWAAYLQELAEAGASRDPAVQVLKL